LRVRRGPSAERPTAATAFGISVLGIGFAQSTQPPIFFAIPKTLGLLELDQNAGAEFAAGAEQD
jgi:hypothetical protein